MKISPLDVTREWPEIWNDTQNIAEDIIRSKIKNSNFDNIIEYMWSQNMNGIKMQIHENFQDKIAWNAV